MTVAVKNNNNLPLVVPRAVRRKAGFRSGEEIEFRASGGVITIVPKLPDADDEYTPAQRRAIDKPLANANVGVQPGRVYGPLIGASVNQSGPTQFARTSTSRQHSPSST
jgi:bifunctional DNA-binding transcriptional regulator/antitoxin component of YhaV-PrlF toxin-antitoxin module